MRTFDDIKVFDEILPESMHKRALETAIQRKQWTLQLPHKESKYPSWRMDLNEDKFFTESVFNQIRNNIGSNFVIDKVYFNAQYATQSSEPHIDNENQNAYTFIIYLNDEWHVMFGGHTIFILFDMNQRTHTLSLLPKPNRGLMFPSNILHFAEGPTTSFKFLRFTLAYKLFHVVNDNDRSIAHTTAQDLMS